MSSTRRGRLSTRSWMSHWRPTTSTGGHSPRGAVSKALHAHDRVNVLRRAVRAGQDGGALEISGIQRRTDSGGVSTRYKGLKDVSGHFCRYQARRTRSTCFRTIAALTIPTSVVSGSESDALHAALPQALRSLARAMDGTPLRRMKRRCFECERWQDPTGRPNRGTTATSTYKRKADVKTSASSKIFIVARST